MKNRSKNILSFLMLFFVFIAFAQTQVTGVVSNDAGEPLGGVTVVSDNGEVAVTNEDGTYTIQAYEGENLTFTFIGLTDQVVAVSGTTVDAVFIKEKQDYIEAGERMIVTASGKSLKKQDDLSSSTAVQTEVLQRSGESGVLQGLAGKSSGVRITKNSGDPGTGAYIQIRGQNTIEGSTQPLIVIDGMIMSNDSDDGNPNSLATEGTSQQSRLNDINPDDIESMTVLKSAAATALYGTQAANGAIIIKTKSGKGKARWNGNVSLTYGIDEINEEWSKQTTFGAGSSGLYNNNNPLGTGFFAGTSWGDKIADRSGAADGVVTSGRKFIAEDGTVYYPYAVNADGTLQKNSRETFNDSNRDQVLQDGYTKSAAIGLSYSSENSNTYIGFSKWDQEGVVKTSDYNRTTFRVNNTTGITDRLTFRVASSYTNSKSNRVQQGSNLSGLYLGYLRTPADFDNSDYKGTYVDANGNSFYNRQRGFRNFLGSSTPAYNNPGWTVNEQYNPTNVNRFMVSPTLVYKVTDNITATGTYGIDFYDDKRETFFPVNSAGNYSNGMYRRDELSEKIQTYNFNLTGEHTLADHVKMNWVGGYMLTSNRFERLSGQIVNFTNPFVSFHDFKDFGNSSSIDSSVDQYTQETKTHAFYGVIGFDLYDQVLLEFTGRLENPSTLPNQTLFFPSASLGWKFTENFDSGILSFGKLRTSYGEVAVAPPAYLTNPNYSTAVIDSSWGDSLDGAQYGNTFEESRIKPNPDLKEERIKEFEIGLDTKWFNNRVSLNGTFYNRKTTDAIVEQSLSNATGFTSIYSNNATLKNKGVEVDFDGVIIKNSDLRWKIFGNFSTNKNDVELTGAPSFLDGFSGTQSVAANGQPFGILYGGTYARNDDGSLLLDANGFAQGSGEQGFIGNPNPDWTGGLGTELSYKGFTVSALVETSQGNQVWNGTKGVLYTFGVHPETANEVTVSAAEAATIVNASGDAIVNIANANSDGTYTVRGNLKDFGAGTVLLDENWYTGDGGGFGTIDEQFVEDASWIKLREISLSYALPKKIVDRLHLTDITFGVTGRNLVTWTDVEGFDPESNLTGSGKGRGIEYFTNPSTRSYLFNLKIGF